MQAARKVSSTIKPDREKALFLKVTESEGNKVFHYVSRPASGTVTRTSAEAFLRRSVPGCVHGGSHSSDACRVLNIPQFSGTCWFNTILITTLFSAGMNRIVRGKVGMWESEDPDARYVYSWMTRLMSEDAIRRATNNEDLRIAKPECLLARLHRFDAQTFDFDPSSRMGYSSALYISPILDFLKVRHLIFRYGTVIENSDGYSVDRFSDRFDAADVVVLINSGIHPADTHRPSSSTPLSPDEELEKWEIQEDDDRRRATIEIEDRAREFSSNSSHRLDDLTRDLRLGDDVIQLGSGKFKLDAIHLVSKMKRAIGHAISGITCADGSRHVVDSNEQVGDGTKCSTIPYDWGRGVDFVIDPRLRCGVLELEEASEDDDEHALVFNLYNPRNVFLYTRIDGRYESESSPYSEYNDTPSDNLDADLMTTRVGMPSCVDRATRRALRMLQNLHRSVPSDDMTRDDVQAFIAALVRFYVQMEPVMMEMSSCHEGLSRVHSFEDKIRRALKKVLHRISRSMDGKDIEERTGGLLADILEIYTGGEQETLRQEWEMLSAILRSSGMIYEPTEGEADGSSPLIREEIVWENTNNSYLWGGRGARPVPCARRRPKGERRKRNHSRSQ